MVTIILKCIAAHDLSGGVLIQLLEEEPFQRFVFRHLGQTLISGNGQPDF